MADNVGYTPGTGALVAADEIAGVLHQRVKIGVGADGTAVDVSAANPLPITAPSGVSISGTVTVDTGLAQPLTDAQLRASAVPISGTVTANTGLTQPLTDAQLRATPVSVAEFDPSTATSFGPITTANTALFSAVDTAGERSAVLQLSGLWDGGISFQASQNGTDWFDAPGVSQNNEPTPTATVYAPDVIVVPITARFFRAVTTTDFSGSVSGSYTLRTFDAPGFYQKSVLVDVDPQLSLPVAGADPQGYARRLSLSELGQVVPADGRTFVGSLSRIGTIWQAETTGYNSIVVQVLVQVAGTFTLTFQTSNDATTWTAISGWPVAGAAAPVSTTAAAGQWVFPALGRYFRVQVTAYTSGIPAAVGILKSAPAFFPASSPSIAANSSVNIAQIGATAPVTGGVAGILAIGGNIAVGAAPTANPIPLAWDGTNTRRILTDAVSGGVALGAAGVSNGASVSTLISAATNNLTQLKASLGKVFIIDIQNTVASIRYLKLFALPSASVTMGTTNATLNFSIPASGKLSIVTDLGINVGGTGISYALTGGSALNDNTAIGAGDLICNFQFV